MIDNAENCDMAEVLREIREIADKYQIKFVFAGDSFKTTINNIESTFTVKDSRVDTDAIVRSLNALGEKPKMTVYKHRKRGTEYSVIGEGMIQVDPDSKIEDYTSVVIYKGDDGQIWVRERDKFHDGRFQKIVKEIPNAEN